MFVQENRIDGKNRVHDGAMDASTNPLPRRPEARSQHERAAAVGDDGNIPEHRSAHSNDELERSGDIISLEEARLQFSEEELDRLLSHRLLRGESGAEFWLRDDVERILGLG